MTDVNNHIAYSLADIQRYLQGGMTAKEMHDLERSALEDPFLADALEGYNEADTEQAQTHLTQIETTINQQREESKVVPFIRRKKYTGWQAAAAVIAVVCVAGISYFIFNKNDKEAVLAKNKSSSVVMKADSMQIQAPAQMASPRMADSGAFAESKKASAEKDNTSLTNNHKVKETAGPRAPEAKAAAPSAANKNDAAIASALGIPRAANDSAAGLAGDKDYKTISADLIPTSKSFVRANDIRGTVTDNHQQPVPNARVLLQDSTQAITDRNGYFSLPATGNTATASVSAFGYKPLQNQRLQKGLNNITLKERPFVLSDVEVINIGTAGKKTGDTTATMPEGGWQSFREYVYARLHKKYDSTSISNAYIEGGNLQLEFSISDAGEPVNFKVIHAPDTQIANEAIDAIKTGPRWIIAGTKNKMRVTVKH